MLGNYVSTIRTEHGGTPVPTNTSLNFGAMKLEPMQKAVGAIADTFEISTCVIDGVFASEVYLPINTGLYELARQTRTGAQVAADVQRAFDAGYPWK